MTGYFGRQLGTIIQKNTVIKHFSPALLSRYKHSIVSLSVNQETVFLASERINWLQTTLMITVRNALLTSRLEDWSIAEWAWWHHQPSSRWDISPLGSCPSQNLGSSLKTAGQSSFHQGLLLHLPGSPFCWAGLRALMTQVCLTGSVRCLRWSNRSPVDCIWSGH